MPSAPQFSTREELVRALKRCAWKKWFRESRKHGWHADDVVRVSVGPNTFRYFRHLPVQPSAVYRGWAIRAVAQQLAEDLCRCDDQREFDVLLRRVVGSLRRTWLRRMGWVSSWPQYSSVQATIQDCAFEANVPAIALDVLAWNHTH